MTLLPALPPLFNPVTARPPLSPTEVLAGPFGLLAFVPLVPLVIWAARYHRRAALIGGGLLWMLATLRPLGTLVVLAGLAAATGWVLLLGRWRRRALTPAIGRCHTGLSERGMIALLWLGLHALVLPLWWQTQHAAWYPSRMQVLHAAGLAYFLLRFIAWGAALARDPRPPLRLALDTPHRALPDGRAAAGLAERDAACQGLADTACWLLYPPCMRLGPLLMRDEFLRRLDAWNPRRRPAFAAGLKRFGLFLLGGIGLALVGPQLPFASQAAADPFAQPEACTTSALLRTLYLLPVQVYLLLWTYNELAAALALWIGIPVDNNFNWLPRATSVRDFWRRWHITLGDWLRRYIYIPLGGNRRHVLRNYVAVFGYCGLWHGPSWSFVAWGLTQAAALAGQRGWDRLRERCGWAGRPAGRAWTALCWLTTMHYQAATVVLFVDFDHLGLRLLGELARRLRVWC